MKKRKPKVYWLTRDDFSTRRYCLLWEGGPPKKMTGSYTAGQFIESICLDELEEAVGITLEPGECLKVTFAMTVLERSQNTVEAT